MQRDRTLVPDRPDPRPHHDPRRRDAGAEARHRAQQRQHVRPEQLHRRHPAGWPGDTGHRRAGTGRAPSSSRTTTSRRPGSASCSAEPPPAIDQLVPSDIVIRRNHITRPVSWRAGDVGREESARAEERPLRPDRRQPAREQLGRRTVGLRGRVHRSCAQHVRAVDDDRTRPLREQRRAALGLGHQHPRLRRRVPEPASCATWSSATTCSPTSITAPGAAPASSCRSATSRPTSTSSTTR